MRAARISAPGVVVVEETRRPVVGDDEVLIRVELVGICATDTHIFHGTFPTARYPLVPGHEVVGVVAEVGDGASFLQVGERVAVDPGLPCQRCVSCRDGRPNLCRHRRAIGVTDAGGAADFVRVPARNCHPVGGGTRPRAAVLAEPLACVVHALDLHGPTAGVHALVYGAGTVGLLAAATLRHFGAGSVSVVDLDTARLENASWTVDATARSAEDLPRDAWELVVDATGAPPAIADGLDRVDRGGTFLQVGVAPAEATVPLRPYTVFAKEIRILGSMTTRHSFPRALALIDAGILDADRITTTPYPLADFEEALRNAHSGSAPKVVVAP